MDSIYAADYFLNPSPQPVLDAGYQAVFHRINTDAQSSGTDFTAKEIAALNYIQCNYSLQNDRPHSMAVAFIPVEGSHEEKMHFNFSATPKQQATGQELLQYTSAHELKHASLYYNAQNGIKNIAYFKRKADETTQMFEGIIQTGKNFSQSLKDRLPYNSLGHLGKGAITFVTNAYTLPFRALHKISSFTWNALVQKEENICDKFSVRTFPETNLENVRQYYKSSAYLAENKIDICPSGQSRKNLCQKFTNSLQSITEPSDSDKRVDTAITFQQKIKKGLQK